MTTFGDFASRASGVGVNWVIQVGTTLGNDYVWGTVGTSNLTGVDPRIVSMTPLNRGFPSDHGMQVSEMTVTIDNTDGGASWLLAVTGSLTNFNKYNYTLICEMYDVANPTDYATKTLGVFELYDWPKRMEGVVEVQLVDHALGRGASLIEMPSVRDWCAATDSNRPSWLTTNALNGGDEEMHPNFGAEAPVEFDKDFDPDAPLPLWFGDNPQAPRRVAGDVYVLCACAGAAGVLPTGVYALHASPGNMLPSNIPAPRNSTTAYADLWGVYRSATITKNGKSWHILWLKLDLSGYGDETRTDTYEIDIHQTGAREALRSAGIDLSEPPPGGIASVNVYGWHQYLTELAIYGTHWSHPVDDVDTWTPIPAATVVEDLFEYYAAVPQTIDGTSFDAVRAVRKGMTASGAVTRGNTRKTDVRPIGTGADGDFLAVVRAVCGVAGFDVFFAWDGSIKASAMVSNLATVTTTPTVLDETTFVSISDRVHGAGERHQPFNRAFIRGIDGKRYGPIDTNSGLAQIRQIVEREFDGTWLRRFDWEPTERELRGVYVAFSEGYLVRPIVTVRTGLNGLNLELGDYVSLTWTDFVNASDVATTNYSSTAFRVEAIRVDPLACMTELELVYVQRMFDGTTRPYILDNETTSTRSTGSGGRTATLTTGSGTVTFSSGSLVTDGVAISDQLIIRDSTEAATGFDRNRVLEIIGVGGATTLTVSETDFGSGGPFVLSTWEIRRSYLTFRANAANYGKTCQSNSQFSDSTTANKLLDG